MHMYQRSRLSSLLVLALILSVAVPNAFAQTPDTEVQEGQAADFSFYTPNPKNKPLKPSTGDEIQNIIFFIGDGMGIGQTTLARLTVLEPDQRLHMERLPVVGMIRAHSADSIVTDSAAAGTALASGIKTNNGVIGKDPDGTDYRSILDVAQDKGMATGLVATSSITHATPASFASHNVSRDNQTEIAKDILEHHPDVLLGGGKAFFVTEKAGGKRKDGRNLIEEAQSTGYVFIETRKEMRQTKGKRLLGLFAEGSMTTREPEPTIAEMTQKAIKVLRKDKDGFFLMVEGSQIDWAAHDNNQDDTVKQTLQFDQAIAVAINFAARNGKTLVVVTADHETGGLVVLGKSKNGIKVKWATGGHSATPLLVYAYGPHATKFGGVLDNTDLPKIMAGLLGVHDFPKVSE